MKKFHLVLAICALFLTTLACGGTTAPKQPTAPIAPITITNDLTQINLCQAIPQEDIEAVMGRKLDKAPEFFPYITTVDSVAGRTEAKKNQDVKPNFG